MGLQTKGARIMNKKEMLEELTKGKRLTHIYFTPNEWVELSRVPMSWLYIFEDGVETEASQFWSDRDSTGWDNGWTIFEGYAR